MASSLPSASLALPRWLQARMQMLNLADRYRDRWVVHCTLWGAIALGIVPAVVAPNILPIDNFILHFGIEVESITYLPANVCLVLFLLGAAAAVVQRRFWCIPLLLPMLALFIFDLDRLTSKLPSYSEAQDVQQANYNRVEEPDQPITVETIRNKLGEVKLSNDDLVAFDRDLVTGKLEKIEQDQLNIDTNQDAEKRKKKIKKEIRDIRKYISQQERNSRQGSVQLNRILKALRDTAIVSTLSFGITDRHLKHRLEAAHRDVSRQRSKFISKRNAARAKLKRLYRELALIDEISNRLLRLNAEVDTYLWASESLQAWRDSRIYGFACFLVLLTIVARFSVGSWAYLFTLGAALVVTIFYVEAPLFFRGWNIATFILASLLLRIFYLAMVNNFPLLRRQPGPFLRKTAMATALYYTPFTVLICASVYLSNSIETELEEWIYLSEDITDSRPGEETLRRDIDTGIDAYFEKRENKALGDINKVSSAGKKGVDNVKNGIIKAYTDTFPPDLGPDFQVETCWRPDHWVLETADCIQKEVKHSLDQGYRQVRASQLAALQSSVNSYAARVGGVGEDAAAIAREDLKASILSIRLSVKKVLNRIYSAIDFYTGMGQIVLLLMILKSLSYMYARIFFATDPEDGDRHLQFETNPQPSQSGSVREVAERIALTPEMGEYFFVNKRFDFANAPPDEVTPQAHMALFSRVINGVWHMNRVDTNPWQGAMAPPFRLIPGDERVVAWTLKPGDAVIFSWKQFVGMNEAIRIRTQYSWQLSSLVFGRMFYVVASVDRESDSDGCLLLNARGSHGIDAADNPSTSPHQLLAWQTTTRFRMHAKLSWRNIYRSGIQIQPLDGDLAVMHLEGRKRKSGAATLLKCFLVPV